MSDTQMCKDEDCPLRIDCYRFNATPDSLGQSYFMESPREDKKCEYHLIRKPVKSNREMFYELCDILKEKK